MNKNKTENVTDFVEYNDENLEHILAGPDYGQPWSSSAWNEIDSVEYPDYVNEIAIKIFSNKYKCNS